MPCLNEAETVATCVRKAMGFLAESGIDGEVVVADNGSTDGSQRLATDARARVRALQDQGDGNPPMGRMRPPRGPCGPGETAGGTCGSCCCSARAGCSSYLAWCCCCSASSPGPSSRPARSASGA